MQLCLVRASYVVTSVVLCRSHQSMTVSFIGISHVYAWGSVSVKRGRVVILPTDLLTVLRTSYRSHVSVVCRLYICILSSVYFDVLTVVSGPRSLGMWRRLVWHMCTSCHFCMKLGAVNTREISVDTILYGVTSSITVFLFICCNHTLSLAQHCCSVLGR